MSYLFNLISDSMANWACSFAMDDTLREEFSKVSVGPYPALPSDHTHPVAAAMRRQAEDFMDDFAWSVGLHRYDVSTSRRNYRRGLLGNHRIHDPKDVRTPVFDTRRDLLGQKDALKRAMAHGGPVVLSDWGTLNTMVDVDYFVDLPNMLRAGQPLMVYTFDPLAAAGIVIDGVFRTMPDGDIELVLEGGGEYKHPLWDYSRDTVVVPTLFGSYTYAVERKATHDPDRTLVLFVPTGWTFGPKFWWHDKQLKRQQRVVKGKDGAAFAITRNMLEVTLGTGNNKRVERKVMMSVAGVRASEAATLPEDGMDASLFRMPHELATGGSAQQFLALSEAMPASSVLMAYGSGVLSLCMLHGIDPLEVKIGWRPKLDATKPRPYRRGLNSDKQGGCSMPLASLPYAGPANALAARGPMDYGRTNEAALAIAEARPSMAPLADHYTVIVGDGATEHGAPSLKSTCAPLVPGCAVPTKCVANDLACVAGRIDAVRNPNDPVDERYWRYRDQFLDSLCDSKQGLLDPFDLDLIRELQDQPNQVRRNNQDWHRLYNTVGASFKHHIKSFQKPEAYSKVSDPRNICQLPVDNTVRVASYVYALAAGVLKRQHWYAFGQTPAQIGETVKRLANLNQEWCNTDFSRWDGTMGEFLSTLELCAFLRCFKQCHFKEINELFDSMTNVTGTTTFGIKFFLNWARVSGSGQTSAGNSISNAFICYCALREAGLNHDGAWAKLGIYGGDDGLTPVVPGLDLPKVASVFGAKVKMEIQPTNASVTFLGRLFYAPRHTGCHVADVRRSITKVHKTTLLLEPNIVGLYAKTSSFAITDAETPILRAMVAAVNAAVAKVTTDDKKGRRLLRKLERARLKGIQYMFCGHEDAPFPLPSSQGDLGLLDAVCRNLGIDGGMVAEYEKYILSVPPDKWDFTHLHPNFRVSQGTVPAIVGPDSLLVVPPGVAARLDVKGGDVSKFVKDGPEVKEAKGNREKAVAQEWRRKGGTGRGPGSA